MPTRHGPLPAGPVTLISPLSPWAIWSTPGRAAYGPSWPNPDRLAYTTRGLRADKTS